MTDKELMQQALNALESCADNGLEMWFDEHLVPKSITALRDRLAQPEHGEDWDAVAERQLASLKRATRKTTEDAVVRAVHKMADELQPEQEPVAWMVYTQDGQSVYVTDNPTDIQERQQALPLYTTPPQRKPLTLEQQDEIVRQASENDWHDYELIMAVEAAYGIKP